MSEDRESAGLGEALPRSPPLTLARTREEGEIASELGANLRRLRSKRGLSLERLARRSGVSRAMLSQIELGRSAPTINLLWKIARALDVTFSALITREAEIAPRVLSAGTAKLLSNHDCTFTSRALFPFDQPRRAEFYELSLKTGGQEQADPHPAGTVENLIVTAGSLEIVVGSTVYRLETGDAILFTADIPHTYRNAGRDDVVMYLVMTYAESVG